MEERLKVGVIGVGAMGANHARIFSELKNVELIGVADPDLDRAREIASKYNCRAYRDFSEIAGMIDAATIVVPTTMHFPIALELIKENKDLLIEKPFTTTIDEAETLISEADKRDVILQVGHLERFNSGVSFISSLIEKPEFIESRRLSPFPNRGTDVDVTLDLMIHDIDIILSLVKSDVSDLRATGSKVLTNNIDIAYAWIEFKNGCFAEIVASRIDNEKVRQLKVFQHNAYLSLDYQTQEVTHFCKLKDQVKKEAKKPVAKEPLKEQLISFVDCTKNRTRPLVSGLEGRNALQIALDVSGMIQGDT